MLDEISKIKNVSKWDGGWYSITLENGWGFGLDPKYNYIPKIGDIIKLHTINVTTIRGLDVNGINIYYKSDEQLEIERTEWLDNHEKEKQQRFLDHKEKMDEDYNSLPDVFKKRIDKFRNNNPRFRIDYEEYEVFCCKEAIKIAEYCKTPEKVEEFSNLKWKDQVKAGISDRHSGNTFGCSVQLAYQYLNEKENIPLVYGALSPLVGSEEYGDIDK